jgi:hypothetical protein
MYDMPMSHSSAVTLKFIVIGINLLLCILTRMIRRQPNAEYSGENVAPTKQFLNAGIHVSESISTFRGNSSSCSRDMLVSCYIFSLSLGMLADEGGELVMISKTGIFLLFLLIFC